MTPARLASTSTSASPDLTAAANVRLKHPRTVFREDMRVKRKQYLEESREALRKKEAALGKEKEKEQARKRELAQKIRQFKAERMKSFSEGTDEAQAKPTSVDEAVDQEGLNGQNQDPVFESRRQMWARSNEIRRQKRLENFINDRTAQSERRLESLLYLYHSAKDFVTYDNIDDKLRNLSVRSKSTMSSLESVKKDFATARSQALKDTISGELHGGHIGVEQVREWRRRQEAQQAGPTEEQRRIEFQERRRAQLDSSRYAPGRNES